MKYYIVHLTQQDGEHEHTHKFIAKGNTEELTVARIKFEQLYDMEDEPHENSMLSYFDGTTAVKKYWLQEIPEEHFNILKDNNYMGQI